MSKKYSIIYLDPPWHYQRKAGQGVVDKLYPTLTIGELSKLQVGSLGSDNSALFMWCTFPQINEQITLFEKWGYTYKTVAFTWVKTNPKNTKPFFGIGYYTKSNAEVCLLGIRGKMKPISNSVSSVIISPRREHSRKPDEARERIVELFGDLPRVELFARPPIAEGWDVLGNGIDGQDIRTVLKEAA